MNSLGYIGSKKSLIDFIITNLQKHIDLNQDNIIFADVFAGTGFVGNYFNKEFKCKIIANDLEFYSYIINYANLNVLFTEKLDEIIHNINKRKYNIDYSNLIRDTYTPYNKCERMYFTVENGDIIDYSICVVNHLKNTNIIDQREEYFLKASILISLDKVANTSSVYGAYLKKFKNSALKKLIIKPVHNIISFNTDNTIYNKDVLKLNISATIGYLDPPYNSRQYGSNYSQLNYILKYDENIEIKGKTGVVKDWNRSSFCSKKTIKDAINNVLMNNNFEILMYSYNNEGLLKKDELIELFKQKYNNVQLYEKEYKKFKANDKVSKKNVIEYLFICDNKIITIENKNKIIAKNENKINEENIIYKNNE